MKIINIAEEFSKHPAGRYRRDGKYSGERFREEYLVAPLREGEELTVILDGARSYGSSFLDEAFAGLVRHSGFTKTELSKRLNIIAKTKFYQTYQRRAKRYIDEAKPE